MCILTTCKLLEPSKVQTLYDDVIEWTWESEILKFFYSDEHCSVKKKSFTSTFSVFSVFLWVCLCMWLHVSMFVSWCECLCFCLFMCLWRLIKGDGEIMEEIVTKDKHREINKVTMSSCYRFILLYILIKSSSNFVIFLSSAQCLEGR